MTPQEVIDRSHLSVLQVVAITVCVLLNALDGFDVLSISFASPGIAEEWDINRAALGVVLSMELIGMGVGSVVIGNVADRFGRRPTILGCLVVMTLGMGAAALATGVVALAVYRFVTGLGIGGMLAAVNAMTAEFSNERFRHTAVMIVAGGYPLGAVIGGSVASSLLAEFDWRYVFYLGTAMTAAFIPIVWLLLPESVSFIAQSGKADALSRINQTLRRMGHETVSAVPAKVTAVQTSVRQLFSHTLRNKTIILTAAYFGHIMTFYFIIKWIPKLVVDMGFDPHEAGGVLVWANVGGFLGSITMGILSQRFAVRALVISVLVGSVAMVVWFGTGRDDLQQLATIAACTGFFTTGAIVGLYALFAHSFPTNVRAGGTGFVIGFGRGGAALGPIVAGLLFSAGMGLSVVAIIMAVGSMIAALALIGLRTD